MRKYILVFVVVACDAGVHGFLNKFISKGRWVVDRVERCADYENYKYDVDLHKKKVNRTHDGFFGTMDIKEDFTEEDFGISIEACKKVDGGCRPVAKFSDKSFCRFMNKHAKENFNEFLRNIGVAEHCPIPKGIYEVKDFLFDNTEIRDEGMVGEFMGTAVVTKHDLKIFCVAIHLHFAEDEEHC